MAFDYASMNVKAEEADKALLVSFYYEAKKVGEDYHNVPYIRIFVNKNSQIEREVTEEDKQRFHERWEAFQKGEEAPEDGTPVNLAPFATPANVAACKAERIYTVEQLVQTPDSRLARSYLTNFKYMCSDWLKQRRDGDQISLMRSELEALKAENAMLQEKFRDAGLQKPTTKKKRRRRKKVNDGDLDDDTGSS